MGKFSWTSDRKAAEREQLNLRELLKIQPIGASLLEKASGLAIGTAYDETSRHSVAVGVSFVTGKRRRTSRKPAVASVEAEFPYIPGLLAFRVGPAVCALLDELDAEPDILVFDGQGLAHPRGFGLASHIGVLYNKPTLGVTRNNLFGSYVDPPRVADSSTILKHPKEDTAIGHALVLRDGSDPCFVSPGHLMLASDALQIVRTLLVGRKSGFPEVLDEAHMLANRYAKTNWRADPA